MPSGQGEGPAAAGGHDAELVSLEQGYVKLLAVLDDIPLLLGRWPANLLVAVALEDEQELGSVRCPDEEIDVCVRSRHALEEEVESPAAAQPTRGGPATG